MCSGQGSLVTRSQSCFTRDPLTPRPRSTQIPLPNEPTGRGSVHASAGSTFDLCLPPRSRACKWMLCDSESKLWAGWLLPWGESTLTGLWRLENWNVGLLSSSIHSLVFYSGFGGAGAYTTCFGCEVVCIHPGQVGPVCCRAILWQRCTLTFF